jgi:hypothetical protein
MNDLTPEDFGKRIGDATRRIAAEIAGDIARDAEANMAEARKLHCDTEQLVVDVHAALAEATDIPAVLGLLKAARAQAAQAETLSLMREEALLKRDEVARGLLDELAALQGQSDALREALIAKTAEVEAWTADQMGVFVRAQDDLTAAKAYLTDFVDAAKSDTDRHKDALAAELNLSVELWDRSVSVALAKASEAVEQANISRETLQGERRSLAASRAHVTKSLDDFNARADALLAAIEAKADAHIAKMVAPPAVTSPAPAPQGSLYWQGTYSETTRYAAGSVVMYQGSSWVAVRSTRGQTPAVKDSSPWQLFAAAGMSGGGFTARRDALAPEFPTAFIQDVAPNAEPGNWKSSLGGTYHVRMWVRTTDMRTFIAMPDAAGTVWVWAQTVGAP